MDAVKSLLGPLATSTGPIQDTVVSSYTFLFRSSCSGASFERYGGVTCLWNTAMGGYRWYCRDCAPDVQVGLEWLR